MLGGAGFALRSGGKGEGGGDAEEALERLVAPIVLEEPCGNARSVENRIAAAIGAQSTRLMAHGAPPDDAEKLFELTAADCAAAAAESQRAAEALRAVAGVLPEREGRSRG